MRRHVIITGTGRSGTSFLVELLTHLQLDTGWKTEQLSISSMENKASREQPSRQRDVLDKNFTYPAWDPIARAGLEKSIFDNNAPYIVKAPGFCDFAEEVLERDDIGLDHIFVPIRDLSAAAESRRTVVRSNEKQLPLLARVRSRLSRAKRAKLYAGGMIKTSSLQPGDLEQVLSEQLYKLMLSLASSDVPITLIRYPKLTIDSSYLFRKLTPILQGISVEQFSTVFSRTVRPDFVHRFNLNDC